MLVLPLFQLGRLLLFPQFPLPQLLFPLPQLLFPLPQLLLPLFQLLFPLFQLLLPLFQLLLPLFQLLLPLPFQSGRFQLPPPPGRLPLSTTPGSV